MAQLLTCNLAVLAIAMLYYTWRDGFAAKLRHQSPRINDRVAYMLWVAAQRAG
jgi:hypothetical protein